MSKPFRVAAIAVIAGSMTWFAAAGEEPAAEPAATGSADQKTSSIVDPALRNTRTLFVCEADCRTIIIKPPKPKKRYAKPDWPSEVQWANTEAFVQVSYTITPEGLATDVKVTRAYGPKYRVPVAYRGLEFTFPFTFSRTRPHDAFQAAFDRASAFVKQNNPQAAIAAFQDALRLPEMSLFEAAAANYEIAVNQLRLGDFEGARQTSNIIVMLDDVTSLNPVFKQHAARVRMVASANAHHFDDAERANEALTGGPHATTEDDFQNRRLLKAILKSDDPISVRGAIQNDGALAWRYRLIRKKFALSTVTGAITRYEVECDIREGSETPSGTLAHATLPPKWRACDVMVYGRSGTTFDLTDG